MGVGGNKLFVFFAGKGLYLSILPFKRVCLFMFFVAGLRVRGFGKLGSLKSA